MGASPGTPPLFLCIGLYDAGVSGKAFASHQAFSHAALKNMLEHMTENSALAKAAMPVL